MKRSTVCPVAAGTAIIRDPRAWHGGTPNLSNETRCMPNVEYYASWYRFRDHTQQMTTSMPREVCLVYVILACCGVPMLFEGTVRHDSSL